MKQYKYTINGAEYDVTIRGIQGDKAQVEVNGLPFEVQMHGSSLLEEDLPESATGAAAPAAGKSAPGSGTPVKAPLPGVVTKINVAAGQAVKAGDVVLVLEAMKMENNICAESAGTVSAVCVAAGDSVMEGTTLLTIA